MGLRLEKKAWRGWQRGTVLALATVLAFPLSGRAADERAVKSRVAPVYPEIAKRMRISGAVKLEVTVDADGKVVDVKPLSGNHLLSEAAEDAVHKWRFAPGPAQSTVDVDIDFNLAQ